jgi:hypothetical protein
MIRVYSLTWVVELALIACDGGFRDGSITNTTRRGVRVGEEAAELECDEEQKQQRACGGQRDADSRALARSVSEDSMRANGAKSVGRIRPMQMHFAVAAKFACKRPLQPAFYSTGYGPSANVSAWYIFDPIARASGLRGSSPARSSSITRGKS